MTLEQHALARALAERRSYRELVLAALDQLALAQQTITRQERQLAELKAELLERMGVPCAELR